MDPNKYKGNEKIKPDTLLQTLGSVGSMVLMLIGIVGLAMDFFKEDGLLGKVFSFFFSSTGTMLLIPVVIFVFWLLNRWISTPSKNETKKSGNLPMYIMMLVGVYYIYYYTIGS